MDANFRAVCLWVAVSCGALALISIMLPILHPIDISAAIFAASVALVLFLRILFSRFYRRGVDRAIAEMRGDATWPRQRVKLFDPEWGLFGKKYGDPALLRVRAVLTIGLPVLALGYMWVGEPVVLLWLAATFISVELSIMFAAIFVQQDLN